MSVSEVAADSDDVPTLREEDCEFVSVCEREDCEGIAAEGLEVGRGLVATAVGD